METSLKSPAAAASLAPAMVAPLRDGSVTVRALANAYMQAYAGRDSTRPTRIALWIEKLGDMPIGAVLDDDVQHALDELATRKASSRTRSRTCARLQGPGRKASMRPLSCGTNITPSCACRCALL